MIIEAAKGGHTAVVSLLLEFPNRFMHSAPEYSQPTHQDVNLNTEVRIFLLFSLILCSIHLKSIL